MINYKHWGSYLAMAFVLALSIDPMSSADTVRQTDSVTAEAKADLAVSQLKAGHPEETARLMRELLLNVQLELPMDPKFAANPAQVLATAPTMLKEHFSKLLDRLGEKAETRAIIESIIDNTVPKNYGAQLKKYSADLETVMNQLEPLRSIADGEELKYGDALRTLESDAEELKSDPKTSAADLEKIGIKLDSLATQAQQMPVGDARPAVGLYTLALVANSAGRYEQGAKFAQLAEQHIIAVMDDAPVLKEIQVASAYAMLKQGKADEFKFLRDTLAKNPDNNERMLATLARFNALFEKLGQQ